MATGNKIAEEIKSILLDQITDPNTDRSTTQKEWVTTDLKSWMGVSLYPRVLILHFTGSNEFHELGSAKLRSKSTLEIQVRYKRAATYTTGTYRYTDVEFVSNFSEEILKQFIDLDSSSPSDITQREANWEQLRTNCNVFNIKIREEEMLYTDDFMIKIIRLDLSHIR